MDAKMLKEIKDRCDAATPGPWEHQNDNHFHVAKDSQIIATMRAPHSPEVNCDNAIFIAHASSDIPRLLEHINRQKCVIAWLAVSVAEAYRKNAQGKFQCAPDADGWISPPVLYKWDAARTWINKAYQQTEPKPCPKK